MDKAARAVQTGERRHGRTVARLACALLIACLAAVSCGGDEELAVDFSKRREVGVKSDPGELTYAYLPQYAPQVAFTRHHLLVERLARELGRPVRQVFPQSFAEHQTLFGQGRIDISFSNPFIYIQMARQNGAKAFARILESGGHGLAGQVISKASDERIRSLADCRGKRWMATDPASAGGYLYPLGLFLDHGLRPADFAAVAFAGGSQERVAFSVFSGEYDIGTVRKGTLEVVADRIPAKSFRVVAETREYPTWVYAARKDLDPGLVARIGRILTSLDPDVPADAAILRQARIGRIVPAADGDFEPVRELMRRVEEAGQSGQSGQSGRSGGTMEKRP